MAEETYCPTAIRVLPYGNTRMAEETYCPTAIRVLPYGNTRMAEETYCLTLAYLGTLQTLERLLHGKRSLLQD
jgi:hypothetical protein